MTLLGRFLAWWRKPLIEQLLSLENWINSEAEARRLLDNRVSALEGYSKAYVLVEAQLKLSGDAWVDYSFCIEPVENRPGIYYQAVQRPMKILSITVLGIRKEMYAVRLGNLELLDGVWPCDKPWSMPGDYKLADVGSAITVSVRPQKEDL